MKLTFYNEIIQFDYELASLIKASEDPMFTSYLSDIKNDIQSNPGRVPEHRQQVINNYKVYAEKMNNLGVPVERMFFKAVYGDNEIPDIKNPVFVKPVVPAQPETPVQPQSAVQPVQPVQEAVTAPSAQTDHPALQPSAGRQSNPCCAS